MEAINNMEIWNKVKQPPPSALKVIGAGRLKGKSDINPQWRYVVMTEVFGICGCGWKYTIDKLWREEATDGQVFAFAQISVYILEKEKENITLQKWSEPIQGIGGSMLVTKESSGLHSSDEGYKMAVTDALGTAMKMLGVAADIYAGKWDGSKYKDAPEDKKKTQDDVPDFQPSQTQAPEGKVAPSPILTSQTANADVISEAQGKRLYAISRTSEIPVDILKLFLKHFYNIEHSKDIKKEKYTEICNTLQNKLEFNTLMETLVSSRAT